MRATNHRPYQGYPYVDPPVNDVPSIDPETASRWNKLPRKQVELPARRIDPVVYVSKSDGDVTEQGRLPMKSDDDPTPVVYIDMPEGSGSHVANRRQSSDTEEEPEPSARQDLKRDPADDPVVYIDLPEGSGSDVAQSPQNDESEYVQETIFYNPFENRRIEMNKEMNGRDSESEDDGDVSTVSEHSNRRRPLPPIRPFMLDLYGAGSSGVWSPNQASSSTLGLPSSMSKETMLYQSRDDGFPMSPIPVSEFPEPPPSYAEIHRANSSVAESRAPVVEQPRREEGPRTQVILPRESPITPVGLPNPDRKYLDCHHCGMRVHTLVIRENSTITHAIALMCLMFCVLPVVLLIYCTDYFKVKNHYCPNCNKIIGYEMPFSGNKIVYVN